MSTTARQISQSGSMHPICSAALVSLPLEPLQARAHHVFDKHVVEVRCPAGISVIHKDQALILAQNIIAACQPNAEVWDGDHSAQIRQ